MNYLLMRKRIEVRNFMEGATWKTRFSSSSGLAGQSEPKAEGAPRAGQQSVTENTKETNLTFLCNSGSPITLKHNFIRQW